jgi:hypothetical protein
VEFHPSDFAHDPSELNYKKDYLSRIWNLFYENVKFDKNGKINIPKMFENVRFHFIDVRSQIYTYTDEPFNIAIDAINYPTKYIKDVLLILTDVLIDGFTFIKNNLESPKKIKGTMIEKKYFANLDFYTMGIPLKYISPQTNEIPTDYTLQDKIHDRISYLLSKLGKYNNNLIEKGMLEYIGYYIDLINTTIENLKNFYGRLFNLKDDQYLKSTNLVEIKNEFMQAQHYCFGIISHLVDIYFLRRFLDKNYITNGIVLGLFHIWLIYIF